jgi:hypothetical protein
MRIVQRRAPLGARCLTSNPRCGTLRQHLNRTIGWRLSGEGPGVKPVPLVAQRCSPAEADSHPPAHRENNHQGGRSFGTATLPGRAWIGPSGVNVAGCRMRSPRSSCWSQGLCPTQKLLALAGRVVTIASVTIARHKTLQQGAPQKSSLVRSGGHSPWPLCVCMGTNVWHTRRRLSQQSAFAIPHEACVRCRVEHIDRIGDVDEAA